MASEEEMLSWILDRNSIKIEDMTQCKPGVLYSFNLENKETMYITPMELYSPPKYVSLVEKQEDKEQEIIELSKHSYENQDFPIGTRILIDGKRLANNTGPHRPDEYTKLFYGDWWFDGKVKTKTWLTDEEAEALDMDADDPSTCIYTAEINVVISKGNNITLVCKKPLLYKPVLDSKQNEIYEDEFIFTNKQCSYCSTNMTFEDAVKGVLKFSSAEDYEMLCPNCLDHSGTC